MMGALDHWKEEIDEPIRKAHQNVDDWHKRYGGIFSGHVKVGKSEESAETRIIGATLPAPPPAATRVSHRAFGIEGAGAMFAERDRLRNLAAECGDAMPTPSEITEQAIMNTKDVTA